MLIPPPYLAKFIPKRKQITALDGQDWTTHGVS